MQLEITEQQREELAELVRQTYTELNPEIRRAMNHEYRDQLHARRKRLEELLELLETKEQAVT